MSPFPFTFSLSRFTLFGNRDRHLNSFERIIPAVPLHVYHFVRHVHPADYFTECRVLPIEKIRIRDANKKLRAGAVRIVRARHGEYPSFVWFAVELCLDLVPGSSHAMGRTVRILAIGIAPLDHETGNDPMKGRAAI